MKQLLKFYLCGMYSLITCITLTAATPKEKQIHIGNHIGEKIDACIKHQVKTQDIKHLTDQFYYHQETLCWQTEFWGKWMLSAVASYRYTKDEELLEIIRTAATQLIGSQLPNGYIGNYSPEAQLTQWDIWGRKYTMLGLLAYYDLTKDKTALEACRKHADYLLTQVGPGKTEIVTTGFYRGMASSSILEPMVYLYKATQDKRYLDFAEYIVKDWETENGPRLISKALQGVPVAERFEHPAKQGKTWWGWDNGQKAYEMMSCYIGLLELYKIKENPEYLLAIEKTARNIIDTEINIAGSGSAFECWYHGKKRQSSPTFHTMETCVTMTWMQLCYNLLQLTQNPLYADQIEKSIYNAMLASMKSDASRIAKYSPLEGQRYSGDYQCGMHINCCIANGPRAFAMVPDFAIMQAGTEEVFINLYNDFTAQIQLSPKRQVQITQETNYPIEGKTEITITPDKKTAFTIALRIPKWSTSNALFVNGEELKGIKEGSYYKINRQWSAGDKITLQMDTDGRVSQLNGYFAIEKGPVVLARDSRLNDGFVDETAQIISKDGKVELKPVSNPIPGIWMAFTAPLILGTDMEGEDQHPKEIRFCDFSSAGNTWEKTVRYRVWIPETLNVMEMEYKPYNITKE